MPVVRGGVSFHRFRVDLGEDPPKDLKRSVQRGLRKKAFQPLDRQSEEDRSAGWVELENNDATEFGAAELQVGEYFLFAWRVERLRVPTAVVKAELERWSTAFAEEHGHPPRRSQLKEQREAITHKLKQRAFPTSRVYDVSWNLRSSEVEIWASGAKLVEEIHVAFDETFGFHLRPLTPGQIADAMDAPPGALLPSAELVGAALASKVLPGHALAAGEAGRGTAGRGAPARTRRGVEEDT